MKLDGNNQKNFNKVLDHGHVRLIEMMGDDLSVVRNARVSYDAEWRTGADAGKDEKLIQYLVNNGHTSPFESVQFTFDIKAPIFVVRQWHRHRTWSYNEVSARYTELPEEFYIPELDKVTKQSADNKQMRTDEQLDVDDVDLFVKALERHSEQAFMNYRTALERGVPRELARCFLPLNTYTHMFATVDLHNLMHFIRLRMHPHAQHEIRVYAEAMLRIIEWNVPRSVMAFKHKYDIWLPEDRGGTTFNSSLIHKEQS